MVEEEIRGVFAAAGAEGRLHAVAIGSGVDGADGAAEVAVDADEPVVIASVVKILLVLEFARQVAAGQLDPRERVRITAADRLGGWGTAGCADDVELSLRDLAHFTMSVSDNTAADLLLARVGLDTVRLLTEELGLTGIRLHRGGRGDRHRHSDFRGLPARPPTLTCAHIGSRIERAEFRSWTGVTRP